MDLKNILTKSMGVFLVLSSLSGLILILSDNSIPKPNKDVIYQNEDLSKTILQTLWEQDVVKMKKEDLFHEDISNIKGVRLFLLDQNLHDHFEGLSSPFRHKKNGNFILEVSFMSHRSELEKKDKIIIQYNLIDLFSGNMFWEHSRTLTLPEGLLAQH